MRIAIIGGGSWGTALALTLARQHEVSLWIHDTALAARVRESRVNDVYLPGFALPSRIHVKSSLEQALEQAELAILVVPSEHCRSLISRIGPGIPIVSATKGLEADSLQTMSQMIAEQIPGARVSVLSGPSFALDVARGDPTAAVIASNNAELAKEVQRAFAGTNIRLYTSSDPLGVEYAGALKNVIAIGAGICDGLGLGSNSQAALITRGLAEITRLACALGGRRETLAGLAGMGDLVLTCTGSLSRNRTVGGELARGRKLADIVSSMRMVAEGVRTTRSAMALAARAQVEMPITARMHAVLFEGQPPREALRDLMDRALKSE